MARRLGRHLALFAIERVFKTQEQLGICIDLGARFFDEADAKKQENEDGDCLFVHLGLRLLKTSW